MREKEIQKEIWRIIKRELIEAMISSKLGSIPKDYDYKITLFEYYFNKIHKQINDLLEKQQAILVYQP